MWKNLLSLRWEKFTFQLWRLNFSGPVVALKLISLISIPSHNGRQWISLCRFHSRESAQRCNGTSPLTSCLGQSSCIVIGNWETPAFPPTSSMAGTSFGTWHGILPATAYMAAAWPVHASAWQVKLRRPLAAAPQMILPPMLANLISILLHWELNRQRSKNDWAFYILRKSCEAQWREKQCGKKTK